MQTAVDRRNRGSERLYNRQMRSRCLCIWKIVRQEEKMGSTQKKEDTEVGTFRFVVAIVKTLLLKSELQNLDTSRIHLKHFIQRCSHARFKINEEEENTQKIRNHKTSIAVVSFSSQGELPSSTSEQIRHVRGGHYFDNRSAGYRRGLAQRRVLEPMG